MKRDSKAFRLRFLRWKNGEKVYDNGRALPEFEGGAEDDYIYNMPTMREVVVTPSGSHIAPISSEDMLFNLEQAIDARRAKDRRDAYTLLRNMNRAQEAGAKAVGLSLATPAVAAGISTIAPIVAPALPHVAVGALGGEVVNEGMKKALGYTWGQGINLLTKGIVPEWLGDFTNPGYAASMLAKPISGMLNAGSNLASRLILNNIPYNPTHFYRGVSKEAILDAERSGILRGKNFESPYFGLGKPEWHLGYVIEGSHGSGVDWVSADDPTKIIGSDTRGLNKLGSLPVEAFPQYNGSTQVPADGFTYWKKYPIIGWRLKLFKLLNQLKSIGNSIANKLPHWTPIIPENPNMAYRIMGPLEKDWLLKGNELSTRATNALTEAEEAAARASAPKAGRFTLFKAGAEHGGRKQFAKGQPWKGTTTTYGEPQVLAIPGEDLPWVSGRHYRGPQGFGFKVGGVQFEDAPFGSHIDLLTDEAGFSGVNPSKLNGSVIYSPYHIFGRKFGYKKIYPTKQKPGYEEGKESKWSNATIGAAVAENPAIMMASGWKNKDGQWVQDPDVQTAQLANSLANISMMSPTHPINATLSGAFRLLVPYVKFNPKLNLRKPNIRPKLANLEVRLNLGTDLGKNKITFDNLMSRDQLYNLAESKGEIYNIPNLTISANTNGLNALELEGLAARRAAAEFLEFDVMPRMRQMGHPNVNDFLYAPDVGDIRLLNVPKASTKVGGWNDGFTTYLVKANKSNPLDEIAVHEFEHQQRRNMGQSLVKLNNPNTTVVLKARLLLEVVNGEPIVNYGYTPQEKEILNSAYKFSKDFLKQHPNIEQLAEIGATNRQMRYALSKRFGGIFGKELDDVIGKLDVEDIERLLEEGNSYSRSFLQSINEEISALKTNSDMSHYAASKKVWDVYRPAIQRALMKVGMGAGVAYTGAKKTQRNKPLKTNK